MDKITIILVIISFITALFIALFQYAYKQKNLGTREWVLTGLRTITVFLFLLILINPKFESRTLVEEKPKLVIAVDNSSSLTHLNVDSEAAELVSILKTNEDLNQKFDLEFYKFGKEFALLDGLDFTDQRTDFSVLFDNYNQVYSEGSVPLVLISDGNQTYGRNISYNVAVNDAEIYPIILGDTTSFEDLAITRVNHNRYVFHKNKFEVETILTYSGENSAEAELKILNNSGVVYSKVLTLDSSKSSMIVTAVLNANSLGVQNYRLELSPLPGERNTVNNIKEFAVEVIDQKTNVAIVYSTPHPDIGALKKSITSNDQRAVFLLSPDEYLDKFEDYQLVILYQPDSRFSSVLELVFKENKNTFLIGGRTTDWDLVNASQSYYNQEVTFQEEYYQPLLNMAYSPFIIEGIDFEDYPPLISEFGSISFNSASNTALYKSINGNPTRFPLLSTLEVNQTKHGLLLGEGLWRWRAQSYLNSQSFEDFDQFIGKLIQYLSSNKRRKRLTLDYESFYNSNDEIVLRAQFFNKSYELDKTASLGIEIKHEETGEEKTVPLLYSDNGYRVDLSGLTAGTYQFRVANNNEPISEEGSFKVIAFDVEQQFLSPNVKLLQALASHSGDVIYDPNTVDQMIRTLIENEKYATIQKEIREVSPLIEWYYLLGLMALAVSLEWFIRKYNGLI